MMLSCATFLAALLIGKTIAEPLDAVPSRSVPRPIAIAVLPYPVVKMGWEGPLSDGLNVTLTGTIEDVASQLERIEPGIIASLSSAVEKRVFKQPRTPVWSRCYRDESESWEKAYVEAPFGVRPIEDAIRHLKTVGGGCFCPARSCCRISCSHNTAVYMCNDNDYNIAPACDYQGYEMVQWINDNCQSNAVFCCPSAIVEVCGGKRGDSERYTITLQEDSC